MPFTKIATELHFSVHYIAPDNVQPLGNLTSGIIGPHEILGGRKWVSLSPLLPPSHMWGRSQQ